ncbi:hypothetical protein C6A85_04630, partial [Mycobacterium sp. ITM-2017-0098]
STVTTGWQVLGAPVAQPFGIAPTGFTRMMQTEGEIAGARDLAFGLHHPGEPGGCDAERLGDRCAEHLPAGGDRG